MPELPSLTSLPSLPLSQQILSWLVQAFGDTATEKKTPKSTLKNALRGKRIPRSWNALVSTALETFGLQPDEKALELVLEAFHRWDEAVGILPPAPDLSLPERIHVVFQYAIPEVGIRLGALIAFLSATTGQPIDDWRWLTKPFDDRFFGQLVREMFQRLRPDLKTIDERRAVLEGEGDQAVSWRTVERWYEGKVELPHAAQLSGLAKVLAQDEKGVCNKETAKLAEALLRSGRLICSLRVSMREWIGEVSTKEWADAVEVYVHAAANRLSNPECTNRLLRGLCNELKNLQSENIPDNYLLPSNLKKLSPTHLSEAILSALNNSEASEEASYYQRCILALTIIIPTPPVKLEICARATLLAFISFFQLVENDWQLRRFANTVIEKSSIPVTYPDERREILAISSSAKDIAQRYKTQSSRLLERDDDLSLDEVAFMVTEVLGPAALDPLVQFSHSNQNAALLLMSPELAALLPEEEAAKSKYLCLVRARHLAEKDDPNSNDWLQRGLAFKSPLTSPEVKELIELFTIKADRVFRVLSSIRKLLRNNDKHPDVEYRRSISSQIIPYIELFISVIMHVGKAPQGTPDLLNTLVSAIPLKLRLFYLHREFVGEGEELEQQRTELIQLMNQLNDCLEKHPSHGRGWAIKCLWSYVNDEREEESRAEKQAVHFGTEGLLNQEAEKLIMDGVLTRNVG